MRGERFVDGCVVHPTPEEVVEVVVSAKLASLAHFSLERLNDEGVQTHPSLFGLLAQRPVDPGRDIADGVLM